MVATVTALLLLLLLLLPVAEARSATFAVTTTGDAGPGSLRAAIADANADTSEAHLIDATGVTGTINLQSPLPSLAEDVAIQGPGANLLTVRRDSASDFRIFRVLFEVNVEITDLTIANGSTSGSPSDGGGIWNDRGTLTLRGVILTGNVTNSDGGGIYNSSSSETTILNSTVSGNTAPGKGGGIYSLSSTGTLVIVGSTVSGNTSGGGSGCSGGGGIFNAGALTLLSSTVSGNAVSNPGAPEIGGGIRTCSSAPNSVSIANSTISANSARRGANLSVGRDGASAELKSTVLSNPRGGDANCGIDDPPTVFVSLGYNLADDGSCRLDAVADQPNTDPLLGPLTDNGGPTLTHALPPASPAIDRGLGDGVSADQRGLPRPVGFTTIGNAPGGDGSDVGALELQELPSAPPPPPPPPPPPVTLDLVAPKLWGLRLSPRRFALAGKPTARVAARKRGKRNRRVRRGTVVGYRLSEASLVTFLAQRRLPGIRKRARGKARCVKPSRRLVRRLRRGKAKRCTRWRKVGPALRRNGAPGHNRFRFTGRIGRKALRPGRYRLLARAADPTGKRSAIRARGFRIVRR